MVRIKKELHGEKTILVVDYSDLKEAGMIELLMEVKDVLAKARRADPFKKIDRIEDI